MHIRYIHTFLQLAIAYDVTILISVIDYIESCIVSVRFSSFKRQIRKNFLIVDIDIYSDFLFNSFIFYLITYFYP